jgi:Nucleotide-diphospho-sugar transferase
LKEELRQCRSQLVPENTSHVVDGDVEAKISEVKRENQKLLDQIAELNARVSARPIDRRVKEPQLLARSEPFRLPYSIGDYAVQMVTLPKEDLLDHLNYKIPVDGSRNKVLLIYSSSRALPNATSIELPPFSHMDSSEEALQNCAFVNVIFTSNHEINQCVALVPQSESHHIHKFARVDPRRADDEGPNKVDLSLPLVPVSRNIRDDGENVNGLPTLGSLSKSWDILSSYFRRLPAALKNLEPILRRIAVNNTVVVMVTNFGQSELLLNFFCSAKARNLDVSNAIVVALDEKTRDLATRLGYNLFYDEVLFSHVPSQASAIYASETFGLAVMAKVQAAHMVNLLGFDLVFQDVDTIWYKNPLPFFLNATGPYASHDVVFQDDGSRSRRFMTYFANSGFYFMKANPRTRAFLNRWASSAELIVHYCSDQATLHTILDESRSLFGLKIAVVSREEYKFLSGYHFHIEDPKNNPIQRMMVDQYQERSGANSSGAQIRPYTLHMSYTSNKTFKVKFFRQLGEWRVEQHFIQPNSTEVLTSPKTQAYCIMEPPDSECFYRNLPSKVPCHDSPPLLDEDDDGTQSTLSMWATASP